jgi:hypothetical protein
LTLNALNSFEGFQIKSYNFLVDFRPLPPPCDNW